MFRNLSLTNISVIVLALVTLAPPASAHRTFQVLHTFAGGSDGSNPYAGLVFDRAGNLYGTTYNGGVSGCHDGRGCGTVFRLAPDGTETVLHTFTDGSDGADPDAGVIVDKAGNLYGTTYYGGGGDCNDGTYTGCGIVFRLAPDGTETVLHAFTGGHDGGNPRSALLLDRAGNLYGTTYSGGNPPACYQEGCGVVFKLAPDGKETVLHTFTGGDDGGNPAAGLIADKAGNLYGTTVYWGSNGGGTVFKLAPDGTETVLHAFLELEVNDGSYPYAGVIMDKAGNFYGTTLWGGYAAGVVFKLAPDGTETILHVFLDGSDGASPVSGLTMDGAGNLYGTTQYGGVRCGDYGTRCGTVFKITPDGIETVLHAFRKHKGDGVTPAAGLIKDANGNLYGTTPSLTLRSGGGTVFELHK